MEPGNDQLGSTEQQLQRAEAILASCTGTAAWSALVRDVLGPELPFSVHLELFERAYAGRNAAVDGPPPAWLPDADTIGHCNLHQAMQDLGYSSYSDFHAWSVRQPEQFWAYVIDRLQIRLLCKPAAILDLSQGSSSPQWLPGAELNIASSCFQADPDLVAIIHGSEHGQVRHWTYREVDVLSNRIGNGIRQLGGKQGDRLAICMPMTAEAVAIYLGIVKAGCTVVSIADSFAPDEIRVRLELAETRFAFTQDYSIRGGKTLPLYPKLVSAEAPLTVVLPCSNDAGCAELRPGDLTWQQFLPADSEFDVVPCSPEAATNILFSSGTTGSPKALPWTQLTPIKCAMDAHFHHDVHPEDTIAWPTNLGWMMGPWLIYATLLNKATMAIYDGLPSSRGFGEFIQDQRVTLLGLVPSMVKAWRSSNCMQGLDWSAVRAFSSTGECSNPEDYLFLMSLAGYCPVIEYCGGTEIGGAYLTQTLLQPASPASFSTPALGLDIRILDESGQAAVKGEAFLTGNSIGLSQSLLNRDHHATYYADVPPAADGCVLRRHGDQIEQLGSGYFRALGRADDTMNLGGIKVSSAEIEQVLNTVEGVRETAAVACPPPGGGPSRLHVFVVPADPDWSTFPERAGDLQSRLQAVLGKRLNPLFRIAGTTLCASLPRTTTNKIMRRVLRTQLEAPGS
jgi:acetyl-CoA synthetase